MPDAGSGGGPMEPSTKRMASPGTKQWWLKRVTTLFGDDGSSTKRNTPHDRVTRITHTRTEEHPRRRVSDEPRNGARHAEPRHGKHGDVVGAEPEERPDPEEAPQSGWRLGRHRREARCDGSKAVPPPEEERLGGEVPEVQPVYQEKEAEEETEHGGRCSAADAVRRCGCAMGWALNPINQF